MEPESKRKTVIDQLIEKLQLKIDNWDTSTKESRSRRGCYVDCLMLAEDLKPVHREEIEKAYNKGGQDEYTPPYKDFDYYYLKTYINV